MHYSLSDKIIHAVSFSISLPASLTLAYILPSLFPHCFPLTPFLLTFPVFLSTSFSLPLPSHLPSPACLLWYNCIHSPIFSALLTSSFSLLPFLPPPNLNACLLLLRLTAHLYCSVGWYRDHPAFKDYYYDDTARQFDVGAQDTIV